MGDPLITKKVPMPVEFEKGKNYFSCSCRKSAKQPFSGGSHENNSMTPIKLTASALKKTVFCSCKNVSKSSLFDGAPSKL